MLKTSLSIAFSIIAFTCMAQGMAGVECTIKNMEEEHCKWYIYNKHDRPVEFLLKKTTYWCHGREATSYEFTQTVSPGGDYQISIGRESCMVSGCDTKYSIVDVSVISKNFVGSKPDKTKNILDDFLNQTGKPANNTPSSGSTVGNTGNYTGSDTKHTSPSTNKQINSPASSDNNNATPTANTSTLPQNNIITMPTNYQRPTPITNTLSTNNTANSTNNPTNNTDINPKTIHYNETFVLFWISPDLFQEKIKIQLNGSMLESKSDNNTTSNSNLSLSSINLQTAARNGLKRSEIKLISGASYSVPDCDSQERCLSGNKGLYCGNVLRAVLTKTQNTWTAYEINGGRKWSGSFTAKQGCNVIEIK